MLNRTNQLSATIIGLNLGTRSLANVAGNNVGQRALMLRQSHPQGRILIMRVGDAMKSKRKPDSIPGSYSPSISSPPCSPKLSSWHLPLGSNPARFTVGMVPSRAVSVAEPERDRSRAARPDVLAPSHLTCEWAFTPTLASFAPIAITATGG